MAVAGCVSAMAGKINATPFRIATLVSKSIQRRRYSSKVGSVFKYVENRIGFRS